MEKILLPSLPENHGQRPSSEVESWPPGFIESTFGCIQDDGFIRHPQGEFERRLDLE